jgi:hypothetical protein
VSEQGEAALTFSSQLADERPYLELITIQHPLARAARAYWERNGDGSIPATCTQMAGPIEECGDGTFFVYMLIQHGAVSNITLQAITVMDDGRLAGQSSILRHLQYGSPHPSDLRSDSDTFSTAQDQANAWIARRRDFVENEAAKRNDARIAARSVAIRASFDARIRNLETLLRNASNERESDACVPDKLPAKKLSGMRSWKNSIKAEPSASRMLLWHAGE